jgi:hypothetical protein
MGVATRGKGNSSQGKQKEPEKAPALWRNSIVGQGEEDPEQLLANPGNWRIHPKHQQEALQGVLEEVGWVQNVIVNQRTQHVIDGHLRVSLALRREEPRIPVVYVDLDEAEEKLILATIDPLSALAVTDKEKLEDLLHDVSSGDGSIQSMLSKLAQDSGIIAKDLAEINLGGEMNSESNQSVGFEARISILTPPEDYETARKEVLQLIEKFPAWDARFSK